jgi:hypothetical protein
MASQYTFLALELARERAHEAEVRNRLFVDADGFRKATPGLARRTLARAAAGVSRGTAALARRLDECVEIGDGSLRSSPTA